VTPAAPAIRGVVFDMDGVLVDSGAHHREAWRALLHEVGVVPEPDFWRLTIGRPAEEAVVLLLGQRLSAHECYRLATRKRDHYVRLAGRGVQPVAGAPAFVASIRRHGLPCAVATSASRRDVGRLLRAIGVDDHFAAVVTSEDVIYGKPHPDVYALAARSIGVDPRACLAFEDSVVGIESARGAGMTVIGVSTAHTAAELVTAGARSAIDSFEGLAWPM
jgi:HAD superfamily hydrolase (TIGR01509 family)